jgi:ornithine cyclodeaminase/alanine dehydrogenase-like protein (mu-crystallin family)
MKILSHKDIMDLNIDPIKCYQWVEDMLSGKDKVILPAKTSIKPSDEVFYNVMPSILPEYNAAGVKIVTRYPERIPSLDSQIMMYDFESGKITAILDGNYITTMRTGAVAAHSIKLFAKENFEDIGFIGLGNQARATIKVLVSLLYNKKITLKLLKYKDQHKKFEEYVKILPGSDNIEIKLCDSYKETVKGSDVIVSSVTYFANDICEDDCFDEGCLVVPIHTRGFMNCDLFFDKVFADDTDHVKGFKYFDKFKKFSEVSDVIMRRSEGRVNDKERILVYNIGLSIHDVYFAEQIYRLATEAGIGTEIDLYPPTEKILA